MGWHVKAFSALCVAADRDRLSLLSHTASCPVVTALLLAQVPRFPWGDENFIGTPYERHHKGDH